MGIPEPEIFKEFPHLKRMWELERKIKNLSWWQIGLRLAYKSELEELRVFGFQLGIQVALRDLEKCGILKRVE